jgi:hypothetical protein
LIIGKPLSLLGIFQAIFTKKWLIIVDFFSSPLKIQRFEVKMILRNFFLEPDNEAHEELLKLRPDENASAVQALLQFENFLNTIVFEYDTDDANPIQLRLATIQNDILKKPLETKESLARGEQRYSIQTPKPLSDFILTQGLIQINRAFQVGGNGDVAAEDRIPLVAFYNHKTGHYPNILDLPLAIANNFTENFMKDSYSSEEIEIFKKNYFVFAKYNYNDQEYDYLFFTKDGRFGSFLFQDEDYKENKEILDSVLNNSMKYVSFDQLISHFIGKAIVDIAKGLADY